uniref:Uncharacterized protein n=1 Tax=Hordeum vulgare subsp. vulgare TaxID=112509 RepID=A0A8I6Y3H3_HORVV
MSLGYLSRVCARVVQTAVRAEQPAAAMPKPSPAAQAPHRLSRFSDGMPDQMPVAARTAAGRMRKAEKDENVMHLICWGPD